jgi:hypothetical protein
MSQATLIWVVQQGLRFVRFFYLFFAGFWGHLQDSIVIRDDLIILTGFLGKPTLSNELVNWHDFLDTPACECVNGAVPDQVARLNNLDARGKVNMGPDGTSATSAPVEVVLCGTHDFGGGGT